MSNSVSYESAGVDIAAGNETVERIKAHVKKTYAPEVIGHLGGFAGLYDLSSISQNYSAPVMVQSIDGVGTKTIVARMADCYEHLGADLLSACSNDILVIGAKTLTMLDYIANDKLIPERVERFVKGLCDACQANGVSLVGGETAEMPDTYRKDENDIVGVVTGVVNKDAIIDGSTVAVGDTLIGLSSSGLHTNGFSLARKLCFDVAGFKIHQRIDELECTVAEALLAPHINYGQVVHPLLQTGLPIHGMAHITGGGLIENLPRVLPAGCAAHINQASLNISPLFELLKTLGNLPNHECFRTFNMGIGYVLIVPANHVKAIQTELSRHCTIEHRVIGEIIAGNPEVIGL